jgi:hypothetical protein
VTPTTENRLVCVLLICVLLFATTAGCYTVDTDYRAFYLSGKYQDWLESGGGAGGTVLNPMWLLGLPILAFDLALLPFMLIYDFCVYMFGSKERKAPWEWDPFRPKWASSPSRTFDDDDGGGR